jgi:ribulose kinase
MYGSRTCAQTTSVDIHKQYLAHVYAFAYGIRAIVQRVETPIDAVVMCGGLATRNRM